MSYILDALRKSELERRMRETPSLATADTDFSEGNNKTKWIIIAVVLIFLNLSALGFWWFSASKNQPQIAIKENTPEINDVNIEPTQVATLESSNIETEPVKEPATQTPIENPSKTDKLEPKPESISDMLAKQQRMYLPRPKPTHIKKPIPKSEVTISKAQQVPTSQSKASLPVKPPNLKAKPNTSIANKSLSKKQYIKPEPPYFAAATEKKEILAKATPAPSFEEGVDRKFINEEPKPAASDKRPPPYLHQMSRSFQRAIPKINLNVQMYSPETDSSFVIIDMIKFYEGQTLGESNIVLEEITPDDVILSYEGELFRISAN